ncbi:GntR family transcriptional regulator [Thiorhodospira sibirica]|uniref:GntR family transcriptional regulator n=1 Tax=Thiorhodospira sibirica TaxID=154347 RepID=UPI00022C33AA|nr:GntR family transcriptional regulator [Thiorhodospira sibirica]
MSDIVNNIANPSTTLADRVFVRLRNAIIAGEIPPGSRIREPELASAYGISRGPLRDAIGRLEACHLVQRRANVGARVISLSREDLLELYLLREALEGTAARLAATRKTPALVQGLRELLQEYRQRGAAQEGIAYFQKEGDLDFHYRIVQASQSPRLINLLCDDLYHLLRMYRYQFGMSGNRADHAFKEHEYVIEAIADGDGEMAELLMRRHIRASRENAARHLV